MNAEADENRVLCWGSTESDIGIQFWVFSKVSGRISDSQDQDILVGQERARFQGVHEVGTMMGYDSRAALSTRPPRD